MADNQQQRYHAYWRANERLILVLLGIWAVVSLLFGVLLVEPLNRIPVDAIPFINIPIGFWIAQQGSIYVFVILIFVYAWRMDKLDHAYHVDE